MDFRSERFTFFRMNGSERSLESDARIRAAMR